MCVFPASKNIVLVAKAIAVEHWIRIVRHEPWLVQVWQEHPQTHAHLHSRHGAPAATVVSRAQHTHTPTKKQNAKNLFLKSRIFISRCEDETRAHSFLDFVLIIALFKHLSAPSGSFSVPSNFRCCAFFLFFLLALVFIRFVRCFPLEKFNKNVE